MWKKILKGLMSREESHFNPAELNDPLALQTRWDPLRGGGANFQTRKLVQVNPYRIEFHAAVAAKLFYLVFVLMGLGIPGGMVAASWMEKGYFSPELLLPAGIGVVFVVIGGCLLYYGTNPIVFDKHLGHFWKGRGEPVPPFSDGIMKELVQLEQIHAVQIISEYCSGDKSSYYSYEINLVLRNADRVNVIDHGHLQRIRDDATALAQFLDCPVWDAA